MLHAQGSKYRNRRPLGGGGGPLAAVHNLPRARPYVMDSSGAVAVPALDDDSFAALLRHTLRTGLGCKVSPCQCTRANSLSFPR